MPAGGEPRASRTEGLLLLGLLLAYAVALPLCGAFGRPGFSVYDEESTLDQLQAWREGGALDIRFARSSLHRLLSAALVGLGGPHLFLLHLPAYLAIAAETLLLFVWLRDKLGERGALWAALGNLVCSATFARGSALLGASLLPALFLAFAVALERVRRPWQAALWGLCAALSLLDYEGWAGALAFLGPYALWRWRGRPGLWAAGAVGALAGAALVASLSRDALAVVGSRRAMAASDAGYHGQAWGNLERLLSDGDRLLFSAATHHPWPAPWLWPLALIGAWGALRRFPWLALLLAAGGLALGIRNTDMEPHRLSLALLAVAAFAGQGAVLLWPKAWGRVLCVALLVFGVADETRAWLATPAESLEAVYGNSLELEADAAWLAAHAPPEGWDVICGLGAHDDGAFRFLLDQAGVRPGGKVGVALVYPDYLPGLRTLKDPYSSVACGPYQRVLLVRVSPADAARLKAARDSLAPLRQAQRSLSQRGVADAASAWLQSPEHADPWARTVAWEQFLGASIQLDGVNPAAARALLAEPLVCGRAPDLVAAALAAGDPGLAAQCRAKTLRVDPRRQGESMEERLYRF